METKINIAEILKDKPQGTKLYSPIFGKLRYEDLVPDLGEFTIVTSDNTSAKHSFRQDSRYNRHGEPLMLLPSIEMRDWSKFAWKKGDVLVSNDSDNHIIFKGFSNDDYTTFKGKHWFSKSKKRHVPFLYIQNTQDYHIEDNEEAAQTYINTIEKKLGGKLNRETLEIEKAQPEFKDWDFITIKLSKGGSLIGVFKAENDKKYYLHANLDSRGIITICEDSYCKKSTCIARLSTEEEKMLFFDALAKMGKTWDAVKKQIVELKPKVEFKPFDKVLCRNSKDDTWEADFFARLTRKEIDYTQSGKYLCVGDLWMYCIPYNEETAHLLGTADDRKGGEQ